MLVHPTQKVLFSATLSNEIFCCSFLVKNHSVCVPSTTADCNFFNKQRIKNEVGGNCNDLVYYKNTSAPHSEGAVLCNTLSNEIFCCSFLVKNHSVCVPSTTADCNLFNSHWNKKVVGGNFYVLVFYIDNSASFSEGVVLCNTLK